MTLNQNDILRQRNMIQSGTPAINLLRPPSIGDGIFSFEQVKTLRHYEHTLKDKKIVKFVPASGKATRMFSFLYDEASEQTKIFWQRIKQLPFYDQISNFTKEQVIDYILKNTTQALSNSPKALIPFHKYDTNKVVTPFEAHIKFIEQHFRRTNIACHFTIQENHLKLFEQALNKINTAIPVNFSFQDQDQSTVTLDENGEIACDPQGKPILNPGGHGILIHNLNQIDADLILIDNIDGVPRVEYQEPIVAVKKYLIDLLLETQSELFKHLHTLDKADISFIEEIKTFAKNNLNLSLEDLENLNPEQQASMLQLLLNRPLRVCGVVINDGLPGGCPFWVTDGNNRASLQLVERTQLNTSNDEQVKLFKQSGYFNPVNIVCGTKNYKGVPFNLEEFVNRDRYFVSKKKQHGKHINILERMGLWNGGMEYWHTIFVSIPRETFCPVKNVTDLLDPMHQPPKGN